MQVGKFLRRGDVFYAHYCPGCMRMHVINVEAPNYSGAKWSFDGNLEAPTFNPSVNYRVNTPDMGKDYQPDCGSSVCHYFLHGGKIQYCGDTTHALTGQTVPLPELPLMYTDRYRGTEDKSGDY